jgi:hypothetical protein
MFEHQHLIDTPGIDVQILQNGSYSANVTNVTDYKVWRKPSLARMTYILAISGGGAGGWSTNTSSTGGGGAGGGAGSFEVCFIPSIYLPEIVFCAIGVGGQVNAAFAPISNGATGTIGSTGANGTGTVLTLDPNISTFNLSSGSFINPTFGRGGLGGNTTAGGAGVEGPSSGGGGWLTSKGFGRIYGQLTGGGTGGAPGANATTTITQDANFLSGLGGGGSSNGTVIGFGGGYPTPSSNGIGPTFWQTVPGGPPAVGSAPASVAQQGYAVYNLLVAFGGAGGGGDSGVAGGTAGNGGSGASFGTGGGGAGGSTNLNPLAIPGAGADGAVIFMSW